MVHGHYSAHYPYGQKLYHLRTGYGDSVSDVVLLLSFYNHADPFMHTCPCGAVGTYPGTVLSEYVQTKRGRQVKRERIRIYTRFHYV